MNTSTEKIWNDPEFWSMVAFVVLGALGVAGLLFPTFGKFLAG